MFTLKVLDVSQDLIHSINVFVEVLRRGLEQGFHGIRFTRTQQGGQNAELRMPLGQRPTDGNRIHWVSNESAKLCKIDQIC
jgi:hypothetical protein